MPKSRIAIIGLGLIGGSIGLALKKSKIEVEIVGHDKDLGVAGRATKRGAVDKTEWNLINACDGAGLIVLALPLDAIQDTLSALKSHLPPGTIITDTATSKVPVLEWANDLPRGVEFIGGDPVLSARREITGRGIDAADAALLDGATYCLVPAVTASPQAIDTLTNFVNLLGAKSYFIEAAEHDGLMAGVQHFPAFLATAYAATIIQSQGWRERGKLAGAAFRVATELAPADKYTARAQFFSHRVDLTRWIDLNIAKLYELREVLAREDAAALESLVQTIADERAKWLSGKLDDDALPRPDTETIQNQTARLFLGGLADRRKKTK
ncbi:MAG: prephenate dehydrogenase/arogenate dehydrogenase family protein [Chloroflexi bacterium]|nr:prephenate dehydrogenase/arogenate dehydrogenase family protein [Chloroflexota bacterium]